MIIERNLDALYMVMVANNNVMVQGIVKIFVKVG